MLKRIAQFKVLGIVFFLALGLVVGGWFWAYTALHGLTVNTPLILHFNDLEGITAVGTLGVITFMGILGTVVVILNAIIVLELEARDRFLGKLTAAVTFIFAVLLFIGFAVIIRVN